MGREERDRRRQERWQGLAEKFTGSELAACPICVILLPRDAALLQKHYRYTHSLHVGEGWCTQIVGWRWEPQKYGKKVEPLDLYRKRARILQQSAHCHCCLKVAPLAAYSDGEGDEAWLCEQCAEKKKGKHRRRTDTPIKGEKILRLTDDDDKGWGRVVAEPIGRRRNTIQVPPRK